MAEAFFNFYAKNSNFNAESAGTMPANEVNPLVLEVMKEKGIDIQNTKPKKFDPETIDQYEKIISFGCLVKSVFSQEIQEKIEDWIIDDPNEKSIEEVRKVGAGIEKMVKNLIKDLNRYQKI